MRVTYNKCNFFSTLLKKNPKNQEKSFHNMKNQKNNFFKMEKNTMISSKHKRQERKLQKQTNCYSRKETSSKRNYSRKETSSSKKIRKKRKTSNQKRSIGLKLVTEIAMELDLKSTSLFFSVTRRI